MGRTGIIEIRYYLRWLSLRYCSTLCSAKTWTTGGVREFIFLRILFDLPFGRFFYLEEVVRMDSGSSGPRTDRQIAATVYITAINDDYCRYSYHKED